MRLVWSAAAFGAVALGGRILDVERVQDHDRPIDIKNEELSSDQEFGTDEYDHDAMWGEETAETLEDLPEEEARKRLDHIFGRIDEDNNDELDRTELSQWIRYVSSKYVQDDSKEQFKDHDKDNDKFITWEEYKLQNYDNIPEDMHEADEANKMPGELDYKQLEARDERRFRYADLNNDKKLDEIEFAAFIHPEEFKHMREVIVKETIEDMDTDKDGRVSEREYLSDLWNHEDDEDDTEKSPKDPTHEKTTKKTPEWLQEEADQFRTKHDKDHDGYLNEAEVKSWVIPEDDDDHVVSEVEHLFQEADDDHNERLSRKEVVQDHMDVFVGSQATDFGDVLMRHLEF